jgi:hypothetical protein
MQSSKAQQILIVLYEVIWILILISMDANQGININSLGKQWISHIQTVRTQVVPAAELVANLGRQQFQDAEN